MRGKRGRGEGMNGGNRNSGNVERRKDGERNTERVDAHQSA